MCVYYEIVLFQYISDRELRKNIFCITTVLYLVKTIDRHFVDDVENAPYVYANVVCFFVDWLTLKRISCCKERLDCRRMVTAGKLWA